MPTLGEGYRAALLGLASRRGRARSAASLPDVALRVENVPVDADADRRVRVEAHGRPGPFASAEYLHVLAFPLAMSVLVRKDFPLPVLGLIHLVNSVEYAEAVPLGARVEITAWAENLAPHHAGTTADLVVEIRHEGRLAFRGLSRNLAKGTFLKGKPERSSEDRGAFEGRTAQWRFGTDAGRRWAAVSGDVNPIHMSAATARLLGMPRAIAHGMLVASRGLEAALPPGTEAGFRWDATFLTPVTLPGAVDVRIDVSGGEGGAPWPAPGARVEYRGWNAKSGRPHIVGSVTPLEAGER
ncbi:MaoC family dehydratase [Falsarthrobacter nasiphocae]